MLKQLVNQKELYAEFLKELDRRVEDSRLSLERFDNQVTMYRMQGKIEAYRELMQLREYVNQKDKEY